MTNDVAFPDDVGENEFVFVPQDDISKSVIIQVKPSDVNPDIWEKLCANLPVLDPTLEPIKHFFHDEEGNRLDGEDHVIILLPCGLPHDHGNSPPPGWSPEDGSGFGWDKTGLVQFWYEKIISFDKAFSDACLDNFEQIRPYLLPNCLDINEIRREPFTDVSNIDSSKEAFGYWVSLGETEEELNQIAAKEFSLSVVLEFWKEYAIRMGRYDQERGLMVLDNKLFSIDAYRMLKKCTLAAYILAADHLLRDRIKMAAFLLIVAAQKDEVMRRGPDYLRYICLRLPNQVLNECQELIEMLTIVQTRTTMMAYLQSRLHFINTEGDGEKLLTSLVNKLERVHDDPDEFRVHDLPPTQIELTTPVIEVTIVHGYDGNGTSQMFYENTTLDWLLRIHVIKCNCVSEMYRPWIKQSIKHFRVVHNGKTLFLSSAGKQTLCSLGVTDGDEIVIGGIEDNQQTSSISHTVTKSKKKSKKKKSAADKKPRAHQQAPQILSEHDLTEKSRQYHSASMSRIFDELRPRLRQIRNYLNSLNLQKDKPKIRPSKKSKEMLESQPVLPAIGNIGGKAGKVAYPILVGEVTQLYKTSKHATPRLMITLDLHRCSRDEALVKLEESLPNWVELAMKGIHPFVQPVDIICGGGSQILSETIAEWIRNNSQVANRPKGWQ